MNEITEFQRNIALHAKEVLKTCHSSDDVDAMEDYLKEEIRNVYNALSRLAQSRRLQIIGEFKPGQFGGAYRGA